MMENPRRVSPLTAFLVGMWTVAGIGIIAGTSIVVYGMHIASRKVGTVLDVAEHSVKYLAEAAPEVIEKLPTAVAKALNDRRALDYADQIEARVDFAEDKRDGDLRPVLTITNKGDQVVTMLAVNVAALNTDRTPIGEWTEVVATPVAIGELRGPLLPGRTRYVTLDHWLNSREARGITGMAEIADLRVWLGVRGESTSCLPSQSEEALARAGE